MNHQPWDQTDKMGFLLKYWNLFDIAMPISYQAAQAVNIRVWSVYCDNT